MLFHSFEFLLFLSVTVLLYYLFPKARYVLIIIADAIFYGVSGLNYLLLFAGVSYMTYYCAQKVHTKHGKFFFRFAIIANVLNLVFFKYTGFIFKNLNTLFHVHFAWQDALLTHIILPIGISFYTFQLIAYIVDVKRKEIEPCKSFVAFWIFVSFFAHLIAGPIMRGKKFLPQIERMREIKPKPEEIRMGFYFILLGLAKKIIFADNISPIVDHYFKQIATIGSLDAWFAAYLFAFQIYFDFSAYSEMAVGFGYIMGIELDLNFKSPYVSSNATEFWKRWHITLSTWIKDYVYISMGGRSKGFFLQCVFLVTAMTISGLWHGAAWTFIIWGLYHGLLNVAHKIYLKWKKKADPAFAKTGWYRVLCIFVFFQLTTIGWVFFRAASLQSALAMLWKMFTFSRVTFSPVYVLYFGFVVLLYALHLLEYYVRENGERLNAVWQRYFPPVVRSAAYVLIFVVLVLFTKTESSSFIYFQF